jgi:hypothetical protein
MDLLPDAKGGVKLELGKLEYLAREAQQTRQQSARREKV